MCINPAVNRLKSMEQMTYRCRELLQKKATQKLEGSKRKKKTGCPFYTQKSTNHFGDEILEHTKIRDIEDLVADGTKRKTCPYYASRAAVPGAQLVALPYQSLVHQGTRDSLNVKLKGNVVIIDEAHNLVEAINAIHSARLSGLQAVEAYMMLDAYRLKFERRLSSANLRRVNDILFITKAFIRCLDGAQGELESRISATNEESPKKQISPLKEKNQKKSTTSAPTTHVMTTTELMFALEVDTIDLRLLLRYFEQSDIVHKVGGYSDKLKAAKANTDEGKEDGIEGKGQMTPPLRTVQQFLAVLVNSDGDGRVILTKDADTSQCSLKYVLLNPSVYFAKVLKDARAVILAGGTLQPTADLVQVLFSEVPSDRIKLFSCGHVVPSQNLLPICLSSGPAGLAFDFRYTSRDDLSLIDEAGRLVENLCRQVPDGMVCFFGSYAYEEKVFDRWQQTGALGRIRDKKKVFREPRTGGDVERVLNDYRLAIQSNISPQASTCATGGAIILSVVGGKLSEGLNFSDGLGRCIIVFGLPFPNIQDPILQQKQKYFDERAALNANCITGREYVHNLCMKAVNQSIGRAIRHANDYAVIILADQRYCQESNLRKLPKWISTSVQSHSKYGTVAAAVGKFFVGKRESQLKIESARREAPLG